jgi:hypothetical protein
VKRFGFAQRSFGAVRYRQSFRNAPLAHHSALRLLLIVAHACIDPAQRLHRTACNTYPNMRCNPRFARIDANHTRPVPFAETPYRRQCAARAEFHHD